MRLIERASENEAKRNLVGIGNPWVQSPRVNNKKLSTTGEFFNGETNAMNLEPAVHLALLLTSDYYQATLERYEEIMKSQLIFLL